MQALPSKPIDVEARALAAVYRLLLQKARERRARLATSAIEQDQSYRILPVPVTDQHKGPMEES